jgi:hypothetical protein
MEAGGLGEQAGGLRAHPGGGAPPAGVDGIRATCCNPHGRAETWIGACDAAGGRYWAGGPAPGQHFDCACTCTRTACDMWLVGLVL